MGVLDPAFFESLSTLILQGGAIIVLIWVVLLLTGGKLHTSSEIDGLRKDKETLLEINKQISKALEQSNGLLEELVSKARR